MFKFHTTVTSGNLKITDRPSFTSLVATLKDGEYIMTIEKKKRKRSLNQNSYLFGVVVEMVWKGLCDLGHEVSKEETHEFLKATFNYKEIVNEQTGEIYRIPLSTATLSTVEFNEYVERVVRWAAEFLGIVIPMPNEQIEIF